MLVAWPCSGCGRHILGAFRWDVSELVIKMPIYLKIIFHDRLISAGQVPGAASSPAA